MKSNEERRSKLSQICTMKTAYHQKYKTQTNRKKDKQTNKKVKVFPKEMSKDYTIYTKSKQTKAKKLKKSKLDTSNLIKVKEIVFNFKKIF